MELVSGITTETSETLGDCGFMGDAKVSPKDFTRRRGMPFEEVVLFMLMRLKCSTSCALRRFFAMLGKGKAIRQQSFSESRYKIKHEAFVTLFKITVNKMLEACKKTWHGYRVLAVDGSKINLPQDESLVEYFGANGRGATSAQAQGSLLYDVLNDIVVDAAIAPLASCERTLAMAHLSQSKALLEGEKKLIIGDRGYPSFEMIDYLETNGFHYVMRVKKKFNKDIDAAQKPDSYVWLQKGQKRIHIRVIKFTLDSGEEEVLITNITDKRLGKNAFKKLYFMRWPVETKYNIAKSKLQVENFTALKPEGIKQDFFAAMYLTNVAAAAAFDAQSEIEAQRAVSHNKYQYKANMNELIGILKDRLIHALAEDDTHKAQAIIEQIIKEISQAVIPIRPNRSVSRNPYPRDVKFHHNRKVNC